MSQPQRQTETVTVQARVKWEHDERLFTMSIPGYKLEPASGETTVRFHLSTLHVVYVREAGEESWGPGFILPVTSVGLSNLAPGKDYELMAQELGEDFKPSEGAEVHISRFRAPDSAEVEQA